MVEFGNLVAGPYCGMLLADLGASVIKVETVDGDLARGIGPYVNGESAFFMSVNRGKRSFAVDAKQPELARALLDLVVSADIVVTNLRQGAMERMGLGYERLAALAPRLVFVVISAFGTSGPMAERPGIDLIFQGESGMMAINGAEGDPPLKTATTIGDFVAGTNAALAAVAALVRRDREGVGALVEVSLRDGLIAVQAGWNSLYLSSGVVPARTGTSSPVTAPNQTFATSDGHVNIAVVSDRHFQDLCRALGLDQLGLDSRFVSNEGRVKHRADLAAAISAALAQQSTSHWVEVIGASGVPVGRVLDLAAVFADEQVIHNEMLVEVEHPRAGTVRLQGSPFRIDRSAARAKGVPPSLGEHTREILMGQGWSGERVDDLARAGSLVAG